MWNWHDTIGVDPSGLSRHVRHLKLGGNSILWDFKELFCALTHVQEVEISGCNFFCSPSHPSSLAFMGSSLVRLDIDRVVTTPYIMASLLSSLPNLRKLFTRLIEVEWADHHKKPLYDAPASEGAKPTALPPNIPFSGDANSLHLSMVGWASGVIDWIPATARFCDLRIMASYISLNFSLVNGWLLSSGKGLQRLTVLEDIRCTSLTSSVQHRS